MVDLSHVRISEPHPGVIAYYDGRVDGDKFAEGENWVDDGALSLGIASYAFVSGEEALVYDTHVSVAHAQFIRDDLVARGVTRFTIVLSHWHLDHIAGTAAFADCEVIATAMTLRHMELHRTAIEAGDHSGPPAITPLIMPTRVYSGRLDLMVGTERVRLIELNIHSDDATVVWMEASGLLLAGDTLEDTVTYVGEPEHFDQHLRDLDVLWALDPSHILPNHGDPGIIATGGYGKSLIRAAQQYVRVLKRCVTEAGLREKPLAELIEGPLRGGWVNYFEPYEAVHRQNLALVLMRLSHG